MATPHVTGALALLLGREPSLTYLQAIERLYLSGVDRSSLRETISGVPLVRTQRTANVGRMLYNEVAPLPIVPPGELPCGYEMQAANLIGGGEVDTAADQAPIINSSDEGNFYEVVLPFSFPFFRESISTIWVSPNGVVHTKAPTSLDYNIGSRAPLNSIAALQTDLIPRTAEQGVRVATAADRVTILWRQQHYTFRDEGEIFVRLTIRSDGTISSSVHFGQDGLATALRHKVIGDPFVSPEAPAIALVGTTGPLTSFSSLLSLASAQRQLISSSQDPLALGITMVNTCSSQPPQQGDPSPVPEVLSLSIKRGRTTMRATPITLELRGVGTGSVPVSFKINNRACSGSFNAALTDGVADLVAAVPDGVGALRVEASSVRSGTRFKVRSLAASRLAHRRLCTKLLASVAEAAVQ